MTKLTTDEIRKMAKGAKGAVYEGPRRRFGGSSAFEPQKPNAISRPNTFSCDVCGEQKPMEEKHHGFPYGLETTWCNSCQGRWGRFLNETL